MLALKRLGRCIVAYRVEAQEKMVLLREKAEKDIQQHNAEMKELIRIIDHDYKLREFMNTKGKDRDEDKQLVTWRERKGVHRCSHNSQVYLGPVMCSHPYYRCCWLCQINCVHNQMNMKIVFVKGSGLSISNAFKQMVWIYQRRLHNDKYFVQLSSGVHLSIMLI